MRSKVFGLGLLLALLAVSGVQGSTIIEFSLDDPVQYQRTIGPVQMVAASAVDIYVENVLDPQRWKDWYIEIWVPEGASDVTEILVDYDNTADHLDPVASFLVQVSPILADPPWAGF